MTTQYFQLNEEEIEKASNSPFSNQLMVGVYPNKKYINLIEKKYQDPKEMELPKQILEQDKKVITVSNINFEKSQEMNTLLDSTILKVENEICNIESAFGFTGGANYRELDNKVSEFKRETEINEENSKKTVETVNELQRKKKENDEFFKKYLGEKKVWLDRLKEENLRDETYKEGFKYLYEAKTIKLLMEGILLEKVQDKIEEEMCKKGDSFGWGVMDIEKMEKERSEKEFELNKELIALSPEDAYKKEKEFKEKLENEERKNEKMREEISKEWKQLWSEIWIPNIEPNLDESFKSKRELIIKITMKVTFDLFKNLCFDVWKFKNIILSNEEYVIMDKIRNLFPEKNVPGRTQEELILNQLMNIIESIKSEEEIIYCDLTPIKKKLDEYSKNTEKDTTAKQRLEKIIEKITDVQNKLAKDNFVLIKKDVEEIKKLINDIPYDNEKKLFLDNLKEDSRLYDMFLPLTNILMVVSFMTVGKKRDKNYQNRIDGANNDIIKMKGKIKEIAGKWNLLKEIKEKVGEDVANEILEKSQELIEEETYKSQQILDEARKSLNTIINLKNQQQMNSFNFYKKLRKAIVRPKDLC